jgi:cholesterol oxidase
MSKIYDYIVIGSGFGGSVSAMRLAQKGYSVLVLEAGKRYRSEDFPETNREVRKSIWMPLLKLHGILRINVLKHSMILSGAGVGGGSLVYGNTLLVPTDQAWKDPNWRHLEDWRSVMPDHYETAQRMLGVVPTPSLRPADEALRDGAAAISPKVAASFRPTRVGVYFGDENSKENEDPYFDGEGPPRNPCTHCGACMIGCRHSAKNTLDKNYLYFAEKLGVEVLSERQVTGITEDPKGGYEIRTERSTAWFNKDRKTFRSRGLIVSAGALGTTRLLLNCKRRGLLPRLSPRLGHYVRTNSEAIICVTSTNKVNNFADGIAITSSIDLLDGTHVEVVTYNKGSDTLSGLATLMVDGGGRVPRFIKFLGEVVKQPLSFLRSLIPFGWAQGTVILLCMQTKENHLELRLTGNSVLVSKLAKGARKIPTYIPAAHELARAIAKNVDGYPQSGIFEILFDIPTTAHIMGGAVMGESPKDGVIDEKNRVFGYDNFYVIDGSMIGANLGVNPSLTITALSERAMSFIPTKEGFVEPEWASRILYPGARRGLDTAQQSIPSEVAEL